MTNAQLSDNFQALKEKIRNEKVSSFSKMNSQEIADLSLEQKVDIIEAILVTNQNVGKFMEFVSDYEDNFKSLMFNINFPKDFVDTEYKKLDNFFRHINHHPTLKDKTKNFENTSIDDRKQMISDTIGIFCETYNIALINVNFYTEKEYREKHPNMNIKEGSLIPAAYADNKNRSINFNIEQMATYRNFSPISIPYHECMHTYQNEFPIENNLVNRLMKANTWMLNYYENIAIEQGDAKYADFYTMNPREVHAYHMQYKLEGKMRDSWNIEPTKSQISEEKHKKLALSTEKMKAMSSYYFESRKEK